MFFYMEDYFRPCLCVRCLSNSNLSNGFVFPAESDSCGDRLRHGRQFVIIQEVIFLREINWQLSRNGVMKGTWEDETTFGSEHEASAVRGGKNGQWYPASLCPSQRTALLPLCPSKDISSWHTHEWGEAALVPVWHWDRITQPPVDEKWEERQRRPLFYPLLLGAGGGGCLTWHISQKQESEGGLCAALTPNGVNDSPVIIAGDCGKLGGSYSLAV